jgi:RNA polymerase sigma-70 factor (ECF subfamily)
MNTLQGSAASDATGTGAEELVRAASGDAGAIAALYDRYASAVMGIALRVTGDREGAEDVVQETFVSVWKNAARFDPTRGSDRSWVLSIAHHRAVDVVRRRRIRPVSLDGDVEVPLPPGPDVWPEVMGRLDRAAIATALDALPDAQRRCIELAYMAGLTQQEIAIATGAPLGTVKSRVRMGLIRLHELLAAEAPAHAAPTLAAAPRQRQRALGMATASAG